MLISNLAQVRNIANMPKLKIIMLNFDLTVKPEYISVYWWQFCTQYYQQEEEEEEGEKEEEDRFSWE